MHIKKKIYLLRKSFCRFPFRLSFSPYFALCIIYKFIHNLTFESDSFLYLSRTVCQVIDCMCQLYRLDLYLFLQQFWVVNNLRNNIVYFLIDCLVSLLCPFSLCLPTSIFTISSLPSLALRCAFFLFLCGFVRICL